MQDFIKMVSEKLGIPEDKSRAATSALLHLMQDRADPQDFQRLQQNIPGTDKIMQSPPSSAQQNRGPSTREMTAGDQRVPRREASTNIGGGLLGGLDQEAGSIPDESEFGESAALLVQAGIHLSKLDDFVSLFVDYLKQQVGERLVERLMSQVPLLQGSLVH